MESYITECGVQLPEVDPKNNYPLVVYRISEDWKEFLTNQTRTIRDEELKDEDFLKKIAQTACVMYSTGGIGIASNQSGFKENWCIIDTNWVKTGNKTPRVLINPRYVVREEVSSRIVHEGCLSVPLGFKGKVDRASAVTVYYSDLVSDASCGYGTRQWEAFDLDAQCVQHEVNHLTGTLFIDMISKLRRDMLDKKIDKAKKIAKHRIRNHNKQIIQQVKGLNIKYNWSSQRKHDEQEKANEVDETVSL